MSPSNRPAVTIPFVVLFAISLLGSACTSDGAGDPSTGSLPPGTPDDDGGEVDGALNGSVRGRLVIANADLVDLATGRSTSSVIGVSDVAALNGPVRPNRDASRFHAVRHRCEPRDLSRRPVFDVDCVVTFDANGTEVGGFSAGVPILDGVRESPDGQLLAMIVFNPDFDARVLRVSDPAGNVLNEGIAADGRSIRDDVTDARWTADGRLVLRSIGRDTLTLVDDPVTARPEDDRVILDGRASSLPAEPGVNSFGRESFSGLGDFAVDPLGGGIVFAWDPTPQDGPQSRRQSLYRIGLDGGEPRAFARAAGTPIFESLHWSPDGRWVSANVGGPILPDELGAESSRVALAADADAELLVRDRERVGDERVVFLRSDCSAFTCGPENEIGIMPGRGVVGWVP